MSVTLDDVRHVAALARISLTDERAVSVAAELTTILAHMEVLGRVDTADTPDAAAATPAQMPLRADAGPSVSLASPPDAFAPSMRDGLFLVPRLSTHEDAGDQE